jgi:hypothetical protein
MRNHIWYTDFIRALQEAAESLLAARNLAEWGDGVDSDTYVATGNAFGLAATNLELAVTRFARELCFCKESGETCEAHRLQKFLRLSNQYSKGDRVIFHRLAAGVREPISGTIKKVRIAPDGRTMFTVRARLKPGARAETVLPELTWRSIELAAAHARRP